MTNMNNSMLRSLKGWLEDRVKPIVIKKDSGHGGSFWIASKRLDVFHLWICPSLSEAMSFYCEGQFLRHIMKTCSTNCIIGYFSSICLDHYKMFWIKILFLLERWATCWNDWYDKQQLKAYCVRWSFTNHK